MLDTIHIVNNNECISKVICIEMKHSSVKVFSLLFALQIFNNIVAALKEFEKDLIYRFCKCKDKYIII